ncbi:unnamed protein product [Heterobilharzia americana]|nr:unnamed protein product [Heterobilharzia americana]
MTLHSGECREDRGDVMKISNRQPQQQQQQEAPITINVRNIREVVYFTYLDWAASFQLQVMAHTRMSMQSGWETQQYRQALIILKPVWRSSTLSMRCEQHPDPEH